MRRRRINACVAIACVALPVGMVSGQRAADRQLLAGTSPASRTGPADDAPVLIEPSAPILNLFTRAQEGIDRRDWKFAIDSLQRIIDDPGGSLLPRDDTTPSDMVVYESTRRRALRILIDLPPEAMTAYRILYDGKAKGLYDRAVASGEIEPLRQIIDRFPLTRYGDDACDTLASWLIDEGRYGETIDVLQDCLSILPGYDVPRTLLEGKLAAALEALGRRSESNDVIEALKRDAVEGGTTSTLVDALAGGAIQPDSLDARGGVDADIRSTTRPMAPSDTVNATLIDPIPWQYDLPGHVALIWKRIANLAPEDPVAVPAVQAVSDGTQLYVRRPNGCAALDLDDMDMLWESNVDSGVRDGIEALVTDFDSELADWSAGGGFDDFVGGSLSLAEGLLFTIEWRGSPPTALSVQQQQFSRFTQRTRLTSANRLVAFDPQTGGVVWQRGRTFDPNDPLGDVEFRAAPLGAEDRLWVPVVVQSDLFLAVLDPVDGSLVHRMLLGSFQNFDRLGRRVLSPTYRDGLVYVPSSRGVVFAVDAHTMTLRWATRYEVPEPVVETWNQQQLRIRGQVLQENETGNTGDVPRNELPASLIVSRGLVLVLAEESPELVALSSSNGVFRWVAPAHNVAYIVGTNDERVWLAGRSITCVSLLDGSTVWESPIDPPPTGWAILTGDLVQIPTVDGLLKLDRSTGERIALDPLPSAQTPLGNLLAVNDSLISVDPSSVRKYPDIERTFASAERHFLDNPEDVRAALKLAWMHLFRGAPSKTFETLGGIPASMLEADERRGDAVAHLRVMALLAMADEPSRDGAEALALLEQARAYARTANDILRAGLAVAERQRVMGRATEAYESLWAIGLTKAAAETITINDTVETAARLEIAKRMRALEPEVSTAGSGLTDQGLIVVDRIAAQARSQRGAELLESVATLRAIAELGTPPAVAARALLEWADIESSAKRYERVDQLLRWSRRYASMPDAVAAALLRLYALYREETGPIGRPTQDILQVLDRDFGSMAVTPMLADSLAFAGSPAAGTSIGAWSRATRAADHETMAETTLQPSVGPDGVIRLVTAWELAPKAYQADAATSPFELTGDLRQALEGAPVAETPHMIHFDEPVRSFMNDRVLFHAGGDVVYCQRARDGALLWETSLRASQDFDESLDVNRARVRAGGRRAVSDGQIAIINGTDGLYAIGVLTGRRLWTRPYETPSRPGTESGLDWRMSARDGLLAGMPSDGRLTLMRMLDGSTVWERDLRGEVVAVVMLTEDRVITADPKLQRVFIFDRADGAEIARHTFRQPDPGMQSVMLVHTGSVICGPDTTSDGDAVLGLGTVDGAVAWRIDVRKPVSSLFEPAPGLVGVGMLGGDLQIIDSETGTIVFNQHLAGAHVVSDAQIVDATLVIQALTMQTAQRQPALIGVDLATGTEIWRRSDLASGAGSELPLVVNDGVVPAIVGYEEPALNQNQSRMGLALIDVVSGETHAFARDALPPRSRTQLNGDVAVWSDAAVLGTTLGIQAFRAAVDIQRNGGS